jgi:hypothetical protein
MLSDGMLREYAADIQHQQVRGESDTSAGQELVPRSHVILISYPPRTLSGVSALSK